MVVDERVEMSLGLLDGVLSGRDRFTIGNIKMQIFSSDSIVLQRLAVLYELLRICEII